MLLKGAAYSTVFPAFAGASVNAASSPGPHVPSALLMSSGLISGAYSWVMVLAWGSTEMHPWAAFRASHRQYAYARGCAPLRRGRRAAPFVVLVFLAGRAVFLGSYRAQNVSS